MTSKTKKVTIELSEAEAGALSEASSAQIRELDRISRARRKILLAEEALARRKAALKSATDRALTGATTIALGVLAPHGFTRAVAASLALDEAARTATWESSEAESEIDPEKNDGRELEEIRKRLRAPGAATPGAAATT